MAGQSSQNAFLTPTTRGLREALKKEGIEFSMPVLERKRETSSSEKLQSENSESKPVQAVDEIEEDEEEDEFLDTDEGASVWLESIGLDKKTVPLTGPQQSQNTTRGIPGNRQPTRVSGLYPGR